MENLYNPDWWAKWARKNYRKKSRVFRKNIGEKNGLRKLVEALIS
jgi:hypothetical protein